MEKGNEHNFTSKQEFKSFFQSFSRFLLEKEEKVCRGRDVNPTIILKNMFFSF